MRRLLLLTALCMAAVLAFAPMAMAQDGDLDCPDLSEAEEQAVFAADPNDSNRLDENDNGVPCEDDDTDNGSYSAGGGDVTPSGGQYQYTPTEVQYGGGEEDTMVALPTTGGPGGAVAAFALPSLALLVASGIFAVRIIRR